MDDLDRANEEDGLATLYDSLQLAHKIILNSFYGYVMKKNARWYSMEMAAMVTYTGAQIIQNSRDLLEKVGKVLELDTDGIWTLLPQGFPEKYVLKTKKGKKLHFGYPCSLMNHLIYDKFKNDQYQDKVSLKKYSTRTEMSIYFELDGPYKAMVIPASHEENKKLKKKYCVFGFDGKISEIKGFELKRRGELSIIKKFQSEIFSKFLEGSNLLECYQACAKTTQIWLDIILRKGKDMTDDSLFELIGESKVLSKNISEYGEQKGVALTAAKRTAQYLGNINVFQSAGMRLDFIISRQPEGKSVSQRAVPISVFKLPQKTKVKFLREWLGYPENENSFKLQNIIDWDYYFNRFSKNIQKIITIPAVLQGLTNPIKDVPNPVWLQKRLKERNNKNKQTALTSFFKAKPKTLKDVEDLLGDLHLTGKDWQENGNAIIEEDHAQDSEKENQESEVNKTLKDMKKISISSTFESSSKFGRFNIKLLKQKWKNKFKLNRKQNNPVKIDNIKDMTKYVQRRVENSSWNIVKTSSHSLGEYALHVIVDKRYMQKVIVSKNRQLFVNFFKDQNNDKWMLSRKKLPRDKTAWFMYQIGFNEDVFAKDFKDLDMFLSNLDVEGVYESQVDLGFLLIRDLGLRCAVQKQYKDNLEFDEVSKVYKIDSSSLYKAINSEVISSNTQRIFNESVFSTKGIDFCLVWGIKKGNKTGIFFWGAKQSVLMLKGSTSWLNKKKTQVEFKQFLQNNINAVFREKFHGAEEVSYTCKLELLDNEMDLQSNIFRILEKFIPKSTSTPSVIICNLNDTLSSELNLRKMEDHFESPILSLNLEAIDHSLLTLNSLTWHKTLANEGISQLNQFEELVVILDKLASFTQIPLANLKGCLSSSLIQAMDVVFARKLDEMNYLSWYSNKGVPDLGQMGLLNGENETLLEDSDEDNPNMNDNFNSRIIVQPGFYVTYVVEIEIRMFILNALINTNLFEHDDYFEKKNLRPILTKSFLNPNLKQMGQGLHNSAAFKIIKELLVIWYQKIKLEQDESADLLLTNLMAWMISPDSKFFDPIIKKRFMKIVTKAFDNLLVKIDGLGGKIVLANYDRLLIDTNLVDIESACNFRKYLMNNLLEDNNFRYALLSEGKSYPLLIIHNRFDYIGVICTNPVDQLGADYELNFEIDCKLKMHLCLPRELRTLFSGLLEYYVNNVHNVLREKDENDPVQTGKEIKIAFKKKFKEFLDEKFIMNIFHSVDYIKENLNFMEVENFHKKKGHQIRTKTEMGNISSDAEFGKSKNVLEEFYVGPDTTLNKNQNTNYEEQEEEEEIDNSFINDDQYEQDSFVEDENSVMDEPLHVNRDINDIEKPKKNQEKEEAYDGWKLEEMLGQSRKLGNLELEFINLLFEILTAGKEESGGLLQNLKKNVVLYLEKDFYSDEVKFKPVVLSFMIHDIKCGNCRSVTSLDIFRDTKYIQEELKSICSPYKCICGSFYNKKNIEKIILLKLQKQIQKCLEEEFFCEVCRQIQKRIFEDKCDCSGKFVPKDCELKKSMYSELANGLLNFRKLANMYNMKKLRRFVENIVF